jgi:hypothetical protein
MTIRFLKRMMNACRLKRESVYDIYSLKGTLTSRCWSIYTKAPRDIEFVMMLWSDDLIRENECE